MHWLDNMRNSNPLLSDKRCCRSFTFKAGYKEYLLSQFTYGTYGKEQNPQEKQKNQNL